MTKVGLAVGRCGRCGKTLSRPRPMDYAVCDCWQYCPHDHGKGPYGTLMRSVDTTDNLYVEDIVLDQFYWTKYGLSPYLNIIDDANYIRSATNGLVAKYFTFENVGDLLWTVHPKVKVYVCGRSPGGRNGVKVFIWDGTWKDVGDLLWTEEGAWVWKAIDVTSILNSKDKINNTRVYFEKIGNNGFAYDITAARLEITRADAIDLTPSTYEPIKSDGQSHGDLEHPMYILHVCPTCGYHSAQKPVEVRLY